MSIEVGIQEENYDDNADDIDRDVEHLVAEQTFNDREFDYQDSDESSDEIEQISYQEEELNFTDF